MIQLSVLDQSTVASGQTHDQSIRDTLRMAVHCESLGYRRFWLSEHHNIGSIAGSAPEVLAAAVAATTRSIRVGTAGVLLPNYSTFKVAEQFRVLEAVAPGRIDMGLGRAPGGDRLTATALNPNVAAAAQQFPDHVRDLLAWVSGDPLPSGHPFAGVRVMPETPTAPEPWMLGSSTGGARIAAELGVPYCFAHFITDGRGAGEALELYRHFYRPSERFPEPRAAVCVWALTAEDEAQAWHLYKTRERAWLNRYQGVFRPLRPPQDIDPAAYSPQEQQAAEALRREVYVGAPDRVSERLRHLAEDLGVDELVVLTWTYDFEARRHSYELLAQAFGLVPRGEATASGGGVDGRHA